MKRFFQIFLPIIGVIIGIIIMLTPGLWQYQLESYMNSHILRPNNWEISIGNIEGHLLTEISGKNIKLVHASGSQIRVPEIRANLNIFHSLKGITSFDVIEINHIEIKPSVDELSSVNQTDSGKNFKNIVPVLIKDLRMNGQLALSVADSIQLIDMNVWSSVNPVEGGLSLYINYLDIVHKQSSVNLKIINTDVRLSSLGINVKPFQAVFADIPVEGYLDYQWGASGNISGNLNVQNIEVPEELFTTIPLQPKFSTLGANFDFRTDFHEYTGSISVKNSLGLNMSGDFTLNRNSDYIHINRIALKSDSAQLTISGLIEKNGRLNGNMSLKDFDLSQWLSNQRKTDLSGLVLFDILTKDQKIEDLSLTLEVQESELYPEDRITASGTLSFNDSLLVLSDPLMLTVGPSSVVIYGEADFKTNTLDFEAELRDANVFLINNFWADFLNKGTASGNMKVSGQMDKPHIDANLICENIQYKNYNLETVEVNASVENDLAFSDGFAQIKLGKGTWRNYSFDYGTIDLVYSPEEIKIDNVHIIAGDDFLQGSGDFGKDNSITLNRIQLLRGGHYLVNIDPVTIRREGENFIFQQFKFHIDDGIAEGVITKNHFFDGKIKFTNVNADIFSQFIKNPKRKISGMMFGEIALSEADSSQRIQIDMSIKNGSFIQRPFENLKVTVKYQNEILSFQNLHVAESKDAYANISGTIPLGQSGERKQINILTSFNNFSVQSVMQFLPDWYHLSGRGTGDFNITGTSVQPRYDFNIGVEDAMFERIPIGFAQGSGYYEAGLLNFEDFHSRKGVDEYKGYAILPLNLDYASEMFRTPLMNDSLKVLVRGSGDNMEYLSAYLTDVDSLKGNFDLELELSGKWDNIIRNGSLTVNAGKVYTTLLEQPISELVGEATMVDNRLEIVSLKGSMPDPQNRLSGRNDNKNVSISGHLDMTRFFRPYFNVNVTGNDVYFRSLIEDIEGLVDINITVTGRDTILIGGDITALDVTMFHPLTLNRLGAMPDESRPFQLNYILNFPINGDFRLTNAQVDILMNGEVSVTKFGDRPSDFAGELFIREGKYYYYTDIFSITDGYMIFDKKGFNPYMEINAFTEIDDERIDIFVLGTIDSPQFFFESSSNFPQGDILELLTWGKKFTREDISFELGAQAQSILGSWIDTQLDRNLMELSGLNNLGLVDDINISGASGLLDPGNVDDFSISADISRRFSLNYAYRRSLSLINPNPDLGQSADLFHLVGVEYKVNRYLSMYMSLGSDTYVDSDDLLYQVKYRLRYSY
ncbi:MAG: translocation/assembly module TamB domain-containing protein [Candidatus Neomarinimicrobiota bacterium]